MKTSGPTPPSPGILLLLSMTILSGCELLQRTETVTVTEVEEVKTLPPGIWLNDCTDYLSPIQVVETNGDLALVVPDLVSALLQCNEDKRALRQWSADQTADEPAD